MFASSASTNKPVDRLEHDEVRFKTFYKGYSSDVINKIEQTRNSCMEIHANESTTPNEDFCPWTFDGWSCVNSTPAGEISEVSCPEFITGFDKLRFGHKECTINGTWFKHPLTEEPWSNYTNCVNSKNIEVHFMVNNIYIYGYSFSLAMLLLSLIIFFSFKSLNCTRVTIHKNLFAAFMLNSISFLIWYGHNTSVDGSVQHQVPEFPCVALHIVSEYFLLCSYFWMFCEGLYLHILLVVTFLSERKIIPLFHLLGWGLPLILIIIYSCCRHFDTSSTNLCWLEDTSYKYILRVPVAISMVLNLIFLINVVRVLVMKINAVNVTHNSDSTKKAVRATLILIPLLGIHFFLVPYLPSDGPMHNFSIILSSISGSLQGVAVAILFCFCNGEVLSLVKKKWRQERAMRTPNSVPPTSYSLDTLNSQPSLMMHQGGVIPS